MMKKITLSIITVLFCTTAFVSAQDLDKVLKNYFEVLGQEKLMEAKSAQTTGKMLQMGMEFPFKQYAQSPNKFRIEATMQDMTLVQTFNGDEGWVINPFAGSTTPVAMSSDEVKAAKLQADFEGQLWNWKEKEYEVSLEGKEEVEGADCFVVKLDTKEEGTFTYYIDSDSYVAIRMNSKMQMQGQIVESDTYMSNYQEGDGFVYAGKIEIKANGQTQQTIIIDEMTIGVKFDASMFEKPAK